MILPPLFKNQIFAPPHSIPPTPFEKRNLWILVGKVQIFVLYSLLGDEVSGSEMLPEHWAASDVGSDSQYRLKIFSPLPCIKYVTI